MILSGTPTGVRGLGTDGNFSSWAKASTQGCNIIGVGDALRGREVSRNEIAALRGAFKAIIIHAKPWRNSADPFLVESKGLDREIAYDARWITRIAESGLEYLDKACVVDEIP